MKHIFVVNPTAGAGETIKVIRAKLDRLNNPDVEIYETQGEKDATKHIREYCTANPNEKVRFYACGGDGTLNEVVNGIVGFSNASMSVYPCGSGNDFVKYYGGKDMFMNIQELIDGQELDIDLLKVDDLYSINMINFGFDTCVAKTMIAVKKKKIIGGKRSYTTGVATAVFTARFNKCKVWVDGEPMNPKVLKDGTVENREKMLLCTVANGQYVGGSFHCSPRALDNDGLADVCLVRTTTLANFLAILDSYTNGTHFENKKFQKIHTYKQGKLIHVESKKKGFAFSLDGEIVYKDAFDIEVVPNAIKFCVPKACLELKPGEIIKKEE